MGLFIISIAKRLDGALDVGAPTIQRLFVFSEEFGSLVDGSYTGKSSLPGGEPYRQHAAALQGAPCRKLRLSEVMQPPSGDAGQLIKCAL